MHPRIQEVLSHLDEQRAALMKAVEDVPPSLRTERPGANQWSVAEILEHLVIVETRIAKILDDKLRQARAAGLGPEEDSSPVTGTFDVKSVVERTTRVTASAGSVPTGVDEPETSLAALVAKREDLKTMIAGADGLALGTVVIEHARFGPLNAYQWLLFLGAHEGRHTAQIREVMDRITAD